MCAPWAAVTCFSPTTPPGAWRGTSKSSAAWASSPPPATISPPWTPPSGLKAALPGKTCYVFGTDSFLSQLDRAGIPVTRDREQAEVLLCGFDTELTFQKLEDACILLNRGVPFVATNPDWVCPTWYGSVPDCGSVCRMLTTATGREPVVIGKPQPQMALLAMERTGFSPEQTVLLGDRLYTDVACGVNAGIDTVFVLSGEGTMADIDTYRIHPTWVYPDIGTLYRELEETV